MRLLAVLAEDKAIPAYLRVAVRAGMLLRKVKRMTTNMKHRSKGFLAQEEVHFPASALPEPGRRALSTQLHSW